MDILDRLPDTGPVTLIAEFTARPGQGDTVAELLRGLAVDVRNEPGNIAFDCYRRFEAEDKFVVTRSTRTATPSPPISRPLWRGVQRQAGAADRRTHSILTFLVEEDVAGA